MHTEQTTITAATTVKGKYTLQLRGKKAQPTMAKGVRISKWKIYWMPVPNDIHRLCIFFFSQWNISSESSMVRGGNIYDSNNYSIIVTVDKKNDKKEEIRNNHFEYIRRWQQNTTKLIKKKANDRHKNKN